MNGRSHQVMFTIYFGLQFCWTDNGWEFVRYCGSGCSSRLSGNGDVAVQISTLRDGLDALINLQLISPCPLGPRTNHPVMILESYERSDFSSPPPKCRFHVVLKVCTQRCSRREFDELLNLAFPVVHTDPKHKKEYYTWQAQAQSHVKA